MTQILFHLPYCLGLEVRADVYCKISSNVYPDVFARASIITVVDFYTFKILFNTECDSSTSSSLPVVMKQPIAIHCDPLVIWIVLLFVSQPACIGIHTLEVAGLLVLRRQLMNICCCALVGLAYCPVGCNGMIVVTLDPAPKSFSLTSTFSSLL